MKLQPWGATCLTPCRQQNMCVCVCVCVQKKKKRERGAYGVCVCRGGGGGFQHHTFTSTNNLRKNSIPPPRYSSTPSPSLSCWHDRCTTALFLAPRPQHKAPATAIRWTFRNNRFNATVSRVEDVYVVIRKGAFIINLFDATIKYR